MEEIRVTINRDGTISYEVRGVKCEGCQALTAEIDAMSKGTSSKKTNEFFEKPPEKNLNLNKW